ncbi:MAG: flagellar hook-basal body complex protein FliE [Lachnospiraceae bacterium]|nr:flagellar hook-basal body complex protein FliE [Lachnospiraceae bacterium]
MDISAIRSLSALGQVDELSAGTLKSTDLKSLTGEKAEGTMFDAFLNTAIDNIRTTNSYLSDAENEEIKFALGETENTHDLTIALQKASTALQYTVAIRDRLLEAYRELMQIQI